MVSERIQRRIDQFLDAADEAAARFDWDAVRTNAEAILRLDPDNADAQTYLRAGSNPTESAPAAGEPSPSRSEPTSFGNGRYQVKRFLGEGGKKRVYLAHDSALARDVAFALIKTDGLDGEGRERITREAQAMGKLGTHPHIVSVFDTGMEGESPYLVTEFMEGGDVEGLLERHRGGQAPSPVTGQGVPAGEPVPHPGLPIEQAVDLAVQVCRGLEFAHAQGLVHRDLKPGNVWLTAPYELSAPSASSAVNPLVAKIGDFGLAVSLDRSRLTRAGMMVGTVAYMPPEQAMGGEVVPRSDLYSLGAMLYEMVCGRPPFVGEESVAIITQHLNTPPVLPTWHRPDCPPGLEALILRLLAKDAGKRPESAREVRQALEAGQVQGPKSTDQGDGREDLGPGTRDSGPAGDNPIYRRTFVGREAELRQLQAAFDGAVSGQGGLVMVVGEPGIGKTAVCEQLATYAAVRGGKALLGHSYEEGSRTLPYLPFVEALRTYVETRPAEALRQELGPGATEVARIVSEVREKVRVEPRVAGDPEDDRWRLYQAVTGFLRNAATVQPLLIILEDLHWADRGTLDYLVHLSRNLAGARLLIIGTYRDVEVDRSHPLSGILADLQRSGSFGRVLLRGLNVNEVQRMLSAVSGQDASWGLAEAVHRQTEGNPLFIQEVVRYLVEEGLAREVQSPGSKVQGALPGRIGPRTSDLGPGGGDWVGRIPEGLRDVIGKRLSRLSPECNALLAIAAVVGRDFDLGTLQAVAATAEEALLVSLEEALRIGVLEEQTRPGAIRYRFAHAFFRQTLYEEMIAPRRLRLHQQVGRALESQYHARLEEHAAELADHFAQSTDAADLAKAVRYGELAAGRATAVYAHGEAVRHLERCVQVQEVLDPDDARRRCDLLLALAGACLSAGEAERTAALCPEAFELAERLGDRESAAEACQRGLEAFALSHGAALTDSPEYTRWAERLDRVASSGTIARAAADFALALVSRGRGDYRGYRSLNRRGFTLARELGEIRDMLNVGWMAFAAAPAPEDLEDRAHWLEEAYQYLGPGGISAGILLYRAGGLLLDRGDRTRCEEAWRRIGEYAGRTHQPDLEVYQSVTEAALPLLDGRLEDAVVVAQRLHDRAGQSGAVGFATSMGVTMLFRPLLLLGRADEALALVSEGEAMAYRRVPQRALALAVLGRQAEASAVLDEVLESRDVGSPDDDGTPCDSLVNLLEAAVLVGHRTAEPLSRRCAIAAYTTVTGNAFTSMARHLGAAALLRGDPEGARAYYRQAIEVCQKVSFRPEIALTRLQLAELLLEHYPDEKAEALEHLDFAVAEFQAMKMQPALERALKHKELLTA